MHDYVLLTCNHQRLPPASRDVIRQVLRLWSLQHHCEVQGGKKLSGRLSNINSALLERKALMLATVS